MLPRHVSLSRRRALAKLPGNVARASREEKSHPAKLSLRVEICPASAGFLWHGACKAGGGATAGCPHRRVCICREQKSPRPITGKHRCVNDSYYGTDRGAYDDHARAAVTPERAVHEPFGGCRVATASHTHVRHGAVLVNGPPQPRLFAVDRHPSSSGCHLSPRLHAIQRLHRAINRPILIIFTYTLILAAGQSCQQPEGRGSRWPRVELAYFVCDSSNDVPVKCGIDVKRQLP